MILKSEEVTRLKRVVEENQREVQAKCAELETQQKCSDVRADSNYSSSRIFGARIQDIILFTMVFCFIVVGFFNLYHIGLLQGKQHVFESEFLQLLLQHQDYVNNVLEDVYSQVRDLQELYTELD